MWINTCTNTCQWVLLFFCFLYFFWPLRVQVQVSKPRIRGSFKMCRDSGISCRPTSPGPGMGPEGAAIYIFTTYMLMSRMAYSATNSRVMLTAMPEVNIILVRHPGALLLESPFFLLSFRTYPLTVLTDTLSSDFLSFLAHDSGNGKIETPGCRTTHKR